MSGRGILDADMRTLAMSAGRGWRWWTGELAALVPARIRRPEKNRWPRIHYHREMFLPSDGRVAPAAGARVTIMLDESLYLLRHVERPAASDADLRKMLALEGDRLLPFPGEGAIVAGKVAGPAAMPGRVDVAVVGFAIGEARKLTDAIDAAGLVAVQVLAESGDGLCIDVGPAMRDAGILPPNRTATPYVWMLVAFLLSLNVAAAVWRDMASVQKLEGLVQAQQPAVAVAQTLGNRVKAARAVAYRTAALRRRQDALGTLNLVSGAMPQGAWLERYAWDGPTVRLSGYRPSNADVATALRGTRRFADVESSADDMQAALPTGEPFDVTARIGTP